MKVDDSENYVHAGRRAHCTAYSQNFAWKYHGHDAMRLGGVYDRWLQNFPHRFHRQMSRECDSTAARDNGQDWT